MIGEDILYGLGAMSALRAMLATSRPSRFAIAAGKLTNSSGQTSAQLDFIIHDRTRFPCLHEDKDGNRILPIESAYAVIDFRVKTDASILAEAFATLASVSDLVASPRDCSINDRLIHYPPSLTIFSCHDSRPLALIWCDYKRLNRRFPRDYSCSTFSPRSPGFRSLTGNHYLVRDINIVGKGAVFHMYHGRAAMGRWRRNTFQMFATGLLAYLNDLRLPDLLPGQYDNWAKAERGEE